MPNFQATSNKAQKKKIHHDNSSGKSKSAKKRKLNHEAESAKNDNCLELFSNPNLDSSKRDLSSRSREKQKEVSDVSDQSEAEIDSSNNSDSKLDDPYPNPFNHPLSGQHVSDPTTGSSSWSLARFQTR
ncbi:hypothetical protein BY996DRAFT_6410125 [Phakopsora pachyrhizi]|nr:hypothetical protein BY996DRAFT_6410125 [Phakopsora pachyrhizi]